MKNLHQRSEFSYSRKMARNHEPEKVHQDKSVRFVSE